MPNDLEDSRTGAGLNYMPGNKPQEPSVPVPFFCIAVMLSGAEARERFPDPEGLISCFSKHTVGAKLRLDMKVAFFDEWDRPEERLKGQSGAAIL